MVATCAVRLAQAGLLDLDVPVVEYVPEWPKLTRLPADRKEWVRGVTPRRLLSHSAGFVTRGFPQRSLCEAPITSEQILEGCFGPEHDCRVEYEPGTRCVYSGAGFVLAQLALERACGRPIVGLVADEVFGPLGLDHTRLGTVVGDLAPTWPEAGPRRHFPAVGSSGLFSTVVDLARAWSAIGKQKDGFLSPEWASVLFQPQGTTDNGFTFGLGFAVAPNGTARVFKHAGWCDEAWVAAEGIVGSNYAIAAAATVGGEVGRASVLPLIGAVTQFVLRTNLA